MSYRTMRGTHHVHLEDERKPWFNPRPVNVGFLSDKVTLGRVFLRVLLFSPVTNTPNSSMTDTVIYRQFHYNTHFKRQDYEYN